MPTVHVNIGSNIGDRLARIEQAVTAIEECLEVKVRRSHPVESAPWGYDSPNPYINLGIAFESDMPPETLHEMLQRVERSIDAAPHRDSDGIYMDRTIDIDLIAVGDAVTTHQNPSLPHPRMHLRRFVLQPMVELDPEWMHPVLGLTPGEMLGLIS